MTNLVGVEVPQQDKWLFDNQHVGMVKVSMESEVITKLIIENKIKPAFKRGVELTYKLTREGWATIKQVQKLKNKSLGIPCA